MQASNAGEDYNDIEPITFEFIIQDTNIVFKMKNIPPTSLKNFPRLLNEDPYTFLFEFDVLCQSYDFSTDVMKLKLFPSTLKEVALF